MLKPRIDSRLRAQRDTAQGILDTLYVMEKMPPANEGHAKALEICIEAREEELAQLNRQ
jgi:hypothetical protein